MTSRSKIPLPGQTGYKARQAYPFGSLVSRTVALLLVTTALAGCGGTEVDDLRSYVKQVKAQQHSSVPPLPKPQSYETFAYNDTSLRDPFEPQIEKAVAKRGNGLQPDLNREREILEQYSLGSLKMVGTLEKDGKRWALIQTPDRTVQRTTIGGHMGQNNGEIIRVTENEIDLREIVPDGLGGWIERNSSLSVSE
jgi:type IV pilus assembly protein PilP